MSFALYQRYLGKTAAELDQLEVMTISNDAYSILLYASLITDTQGKAEDVLALYNRLQDYLLERQRQSVNELAELLEPAEAPNNVVSLRT